MPRSRQKSLLEFQKQFPDEAACAAFLFARRWPRGFSCPHCGHGLASFLKSRAHTYECLGCDRQISLTAGTIMHRSKLPLRTWFWAAHLLATHSNGMSALQLKGQLHISYAATWLLTQKLRRAMVDPTRGLLAGVVEVDQTEMPYRQKDRDTDPTKVAKILIVGAVEVIDRITGQARPKAIGTKYLNTRSGRVRLAMIRNNTAQEIHAFIRANIAPGTTLITDGHRSYLGLRGYRHDPRTVGPMAGHVALEWIHRVFALLKRWSLGTYHGLRLKHIDRYLNEFVFRYNRRYHRHVSFEHILGLAAQHPPTDYWAITGRANGRKGRVPKRREPRRRRTAFGLRADRSP